MAFIPTKCPSCGRDIQIPDDVSRSNCMYCGKPVSLAESRNASAPTLTNYLGLARTAILAGNSSEAEQYFNRVLEIDPTISEAWVGKGKAAAWQSSLANIRLPEMNVAFAHAIGTASDAERKSTVDECVHEMNRLVTTLYGMARKHMLEYIYLDKTWNDYVSRISQLFSGLEMALIWNGSSKVTLENIVHLCKDNIEGVAFRDKLHSNAAKAWHLSPQYEALLRAKLDSATAKLRALDPSYSPPAIEKKSADACFVATAAMDSADHPHVLTLRRFRDQHLMRSRLGRRFVRWYYRHGPAMAAIIAPLPWLRRFSRLLVVYPASAIARAIERRRP